MAALLFALVIFTVFTIKKPRFITSDGISGSMNVSNVYTDNYETYINSSS